MTRPSVLADLSMFAGCAIILGTIGLLVARLVTGWTP